MHGYEMLKELARRTRGVWRPSPGPLPGAETAREPGARPLGRRTNGPDAPADHPRPHSKRRMPAAQPWETVVSSTADESALSLRSVELAASQVAPAGVLEHQACDEVLLTELPAAALPTAGQPVGPHRRLGGRCSDCRGAYRHERDVSPHRVRT